VLVWGDSHAAAIGTLCDSLAHEFGITGYLMSRGGAVPLLETWRAGSAEKNPALNAEVLEFVRRNQIPNVILIARWAAYVEKRPSGLDDALIKDRDSTEHSRADSRRVLERGLERTIAALHELGARVWLMKQVPRQREDPIRKLVDAARRGEERVPTGVTREQHAQRQYHANRILEGLDADAVSVLDPADSFFDASDRSRIGSFEAAYYSDDHHVSAAGAEHLLRPLLAPVFEQIAGQQAAVLAEPSRGIIARP
jgi:hypothetical protein